MSETRDKKIQLRVTDTEKASIEAKAKTCNMTASDLVRASALSDKKITILAEGAEIVKFLIDIQNKLKESSESLTNKYNLDDGFDFLELNDDKPEPRISPLIDASQDELFMAELSGNHIVKPRKTEENKPVFTGSDNESEDIIMNKNNNFEYGNNSINYDNSVPFDIQPVTAPSQYIPPQMYLPQYNFPAPYIPQPVQQDMYYANANMPTNVQQYPMFYPPLPTFFFNNNQNLNVRIPMTMTPDMLNQYISINALTPSDYIDKTKLGMAVMSKFNQQNINANVMIGMDKNIYLDFVASLNNNEKFGGDVIEVPYNE